MPKDDVEAVTVTLVLLRREFETAILFGEEALTILMDHGRIPQGEVTSADPKIRHNLAVFGLQELISSWTYQRAHPSVPFNFDDDDEIPF